METEYSKATEYGNYLGMDNQAFPIDCETLAALQNNTKKLAALGLIAGCNKLILIGCNIAGRERKEGYVFVVSSDNPLHFHQTEERKAPKPGTDLLCLKDKLEQWYFDKLQQVYLTMFQ
jgi:hypothetical protein